jgi:fructokinase
MPSSATHAHPEHAAFGASAPEKPAIWVLGEALIDFVPRQFDGVTAYLPKPGGSPFNAAKAAALAGANVQFVGGISNDFFGDMLEADLRLHGVHTQSAPRSDAPSTLAFVTFEGGQPRYAFFNNLTSTSLIAPRPLDTDMGPGDILSVGSISLIDQPGADNIAAEALKIADSRLLAFDPNVRADMVADWPDWRARMDRLLAVAGLIKLSVEDLEVLRPGMTPADFAAAHTAMGTRLVIITDGGAGAEMFGPVARVAVQAPKVVVQDTVGAGDTLMGTLLAELCHRGLSGRAELGAVPESEMRAILHRAVVAAALNCTVAGCNPPTRAQVDAWLAGHADV